MKSKILDKAKKKKFIEGVFEFGIEKIPEVLIKTGIERVRAFSGDLTREELNELLINLPVETIGLYVAKEIMDRHGVSEIRLSIDGLHLWQNQLKNNIIELSEELENAWFNGKDIPYGDTDSPLKGKFVIIKSKESGDFIGTGKISQDGKILYNYLPKERRRKSSTI